MSSEAETATTTSQTACQEMGCERGATHVVTPTGTVWWRRYLCAAHAAEAKSPTRVVRALKTDEGIPRVVRAAKDAEREHLAAHAARGDRPADDEDVANAEAITARHLGGLLPGVAKAATKPDPRRESAKRTLLARLGMATQAEDRVYGAPETPTTPYNAPYKTPEAPYKTPMYGAEGGSEGMYGAGDPPYTPYNDPQTPYTAPYMDTTAPYNATEESGGTRRVVCRLTEAEHAALLTHGASVALGIRALLARAATLPTLDDPPPAPPTGPKRQTEVRLSPLEVATLRGLGAGEVAAGLRVLLAHLSPA